MNDIKREVKLDVSLGEFALAKEKLNKVLSDDVKDSELWLMLLMCELNVTDIEDILKLEDASFFDSYAMKKVLEYADDDLRRKLDEYKNKVIIKKILDLEQRFIYFLENDRIDDAIVISKESYKINNKLIISHFYHSIKSEYDPYKSKLDVYNNWKKAYDSYVYSDSILRQHQREVESLENQMQADQRNGVYNSYTDLKLREEQRYVRDWQYKISEVSWSNTFKEDKPSLNYITIYNICLKHYEKAIKEDFCIPNNKVAKEIETFFAYKIGGNNVNLSVMFESIEQYNEIKKKAQLEINNKIYKKWYNFWDKFNKLVIAKEASNALSYLKNIKNNPFVDSILNEKFKKSLFGYKFVDKNMILGIDINQYIINSIKNDKDDSKVYVEINSSFNNVNIKTSNSVYVKCPYYCNLKKINVIVGQKVIKDDVLVIVEALFLENKICAPVSGIIEEIYVAEGDGIEINDVLIRMVEI